MSECVNWQGYLTADGYGEHRVVGVKWRAHRYVYFQTNGIIPKDSVIRHTCDNRACVNIEHLEIGTSQDNTSDRVKRNRSATGVTNGNSKLTIEQVVIIRSSTISQRELARQYNVSQGAISQIIRRLTWRDI